MVTCGVEKRNVLLSSGQKISTHLKSRNDKNGYSIVTAIVKQRNRLKRAIDVKNTSVRIVCLCARAPCAFIPYVTLD